jgi:hypothetical protein
MRLKRLPVIVAIFIIVTSSFAQDDSYKFKKVIPADFPGNLYSIDSNASVVILAGIGSVIFYTNKL